MAKKTREWTESDLAIQFGLERVFVEFPLLVEWMDATTSLTDSENTFLDKLLKFVIPRINYWYEEDLKMNFISPLLNNFVEFWHEKYQTYFDHEISAEVDGILLSCKPDFMIAKGIYDKIQQPYFHFHEYKKSKRNPADPAAQVLEAMLIAQTKNQKPIPLYGLFCIGRTFEFMVLDEKKYAISSVYDSTNREDLIQIIAILRKFKVILETELLND